MFCGLCSRPASPPLEPKSSDDLLFSFSSSMLDTANPPSKAFESGGTSNDEKILEPQKVELLILGAGWTSKFLIPALNEEKIEYAATTTSGRDNTIPFRFDPESDDKSPFEVLPDTKTVLITFPLRGKGQSLKLSQFYCDTHSNTEPKFIQLGSTGIFTNKGWSNHKSPYDKADERAIAEDELLSCCSATVLNLAGLYDNEIRRPQNWVSRVAKTKADVKGKQSLHLIHGKDVARGIIASHKNFDAVKGQRWILTDLFSYDWWGLLMAWGGTLQDGSDIRQVIMEAMLENEIKALTRTTGEIGRALDARDFWKTVDAMPQEGSVY
ncbi:uncharacterized protein PV09_01551 [Verruconis gallopava]|uniref:Uncharacterized protein n=1 Tax=Verruconis gallopava TaxID=253628 RepID=A0A0D2AMA9_9PEZI|nr:uncharacterized protein PV09_01551 [Verruconis gallopava]KIW07600.1 hypothetical protein PV09_01551 [Verruconis gallopava]